MHNYCDRHPIAVNCEKAAYICNRLDVHEDDEEAGAICNYARSRISKVVATAESPHSKIFSHISNIL